MKLASFRLDGAAAFGVVAADAVFDLSDGGRVALSDLLRLDRAGLDAALEVAKARGPGRPLDSVKLLPVVPRPGKILCIGRNYAEHAKEGGGEVLDYPAVFCRSATSLVAPGDPLIRPLCSTAFDYEAELAVVIGRGGRHIREAEALAHVAGYACFNDGSVRDYQRRTPQWTMGKNFDSTGPFGPWLVTPDELPPGGSGLRIATRLNGATMQDGNTADMVFGVARLIAILSEVMTLETGDVIATGTPSGVGFARKPPVWLKDGDVCEVEIEGIGVLRNPVRDEAG